MKKILYIASFTLLFFVFKNSSILKNVACAANYGSCATGSYAICPATGQAISACISSVDINVSILGVNAPVGTKFKITAAADQLSCADVTCLKRSQTITVGPLTTSSGTIRGVLDQIGCSQGACDDDIKVTVIIDPSTPIPSGMNCTITPNATQTGNIKGKNGQSLNYLYSLTCTTPTAPTTTPTTCPVLAIPAVVVTCPSCF